VWRLALEQKGAHPLPGELRWTERRKRNREPAASLSPLLFSLHVLPPLSLLGSILAMDS